MYNEEIDLTAETACFGEEDFDIWESVAAKSTATNEAHAKKVIERTAEKGEEGRAVGVEAIQKQADHTIPSWQKKAEQKREEEARKKREADEAKERERRAEEEKLEKERFRQNLDKAVKAGDIPAEVVKELEAAKPGRGVRELVDKILEAHGGKKATSHLDGLVASTPGAIGGPQVKWFATGADEKLAKLTAKDAVKVLKDWIKDGTNPLEPGGTLEQRLIRESAAFSIATRKTETTRTDFGVYNPRKGVPGQAPTFRSDRWRLK